MKNITHILLGILALALGAVLIFIPEKDNSEKQVPAYLLLSLTDNSRFVSTDEMADLIINQDPTLLPIDVRPESEFNAFTIPGSVNIPLEKMLDEDAVPYLENDDMKKIFFSNDDLTSSQAWMMAKRNGYENVYIMKGGLNHWTETIIRPIEPPATASKEAFKLYNLRKATSLFFIGGSQELKPEEYRIVTQPKPKKKVTVVPKSKKQQVEEEEGC